MSLQLKNWFLLFQYAASSSFGSYKTINVISKEAFEKIAPKAPRKANPEVPPPPPTPMDEQATDSTSQQSRDRELLAEKRRKNEMNRQNRRAVPRFFAVVKDEAAVDPRTPRKRKTRHSNNPPIEHHVGWIMDVREHRPRTYSGLVRNFE